MDLCYKCTCYRFNVIPDLLQVAMAMRRKESALKDDNVGDGPLKPVDWRVKVEIVLLKLNERNLTFKSSAFPCPFFTLPEIAAKLTILLDIILS